MLTLSCPAAPAKVINASGGHYFSQMLRVKGNEIVNYCYLQINRQTSEAFLIDPAWDRSKIEQALTASGCRLKAILLTHHHHDHTNLASELASSSGVPVYMSRTEIDYYGFQCANLETLKVGSSTIAGLEVEALLTPGHTAGSMCFRVGGNLFSGDTLFIEGCGLCAGEGADPLSLFQSIVELNRQLPDSCRVFPGHRFKRLPGMTMSYVRKYNIYLQTQSAADFVSFHSRQRVSDQIRYL